MRQFSLVKERQSLEQDILGDSYQIKEMRELIARFAPSNHSVLIHGETGTGKELVARALHKMAVGRYGKFVVVDCGSLSQGVIESELFGHVKGAFTGADASSLGLLASAERGTIFLDEIGELPMISQSRLLRALQEREIRPMGSTRLVPIDVRVISATNRNLANAVKEGTFRQDLFYRINTLDIDVPALNDRLGDKILLAKHFLSQLSKSRSFSLEALEFIDSSFWPGNVRQLLNAVIRGNLLSNNNLIASINMMEGDQKHKQIDPIAHPLKLLAEIEKEMILKVLVEENNNTVKAAKRLGMGKTTLYRRLKEYDCA